MGNIKISKKYKRRLEREKENEALRKEISTTLNAMTYAEMRDYQQSLQQDVGASEEDFLKIQIKILENSLRKKSRVTISNSRKGKEDPGNEKLDQLMRTLFLNGLQEKRNKLEEDEAEYDESGEEGGIYWAMNEEKWTAYKRVEQVAIEEDRKRAHDAKEERRKNFIKLPVGRNYVKKGDSKRGRPPKKRNR
jgi:hypothetical protein